MQTLVYISTRALSNLLPHPILLIESVNEVSTGELPSFLTHTTAAELIIICFSFSSIPFHFLPHHCYVAADDRQFGHRFLGSVNRRPPGLFLVAHFSSYR